MADRVKMKFDTETQVTIPKKGVEELMLFALKEKGVVPLDAKVSVDLSASVGARCSWKMTWRSTA